MQTRSWVIEVGGATDDHYANLTPQQTKSLLPTLENMIYFLWLQLIQLSFSQPVKQKYGSKLHNKSLASLKPEISQALSLLQGELHSIEAS